jgi:hypothetical protein
VAREDSFSEGQSIALAFDRLSLWNFRSGREVRKIATDR